MLRYKQIIFFYLLAIFVGAFTGVLGSCFQWAILKLVDVLDWFKLYAASNGMPRVVCSAVITMILVSIAFLLVRRIAPETAGSGVPEIESRLLNLRPLRWRRVLPVKFIAGVCAISSNLVLGREGPTIQMGGAVGQMVGEFFRLNAKRCDALVAAGAAAGLSTAFNAPLAGAMFVMEEMRDSFSLPFIHFQIVVMSCVASNVVMHALLGARASIIMPILAAPALNTLWQFLIFGLFVGLVGIAFNQALLTSLRWMDRNIGQFRVLYVIVVAFIIGGLAIIWPDVVGDGYHLIEHALSLTPGLGVLMMIFLARFITSILSYNVGVPGGIFAPLLALGTLMGLIFSVVLHLIIPGIAVEPALFVVAGMGALFAATVRAPITGIILIVEITQNYLLILPLMVTCLVAATVVQLAGVSPIYTRLLRRAFDR